jgi:hypothetical protein
MEQWTFLLFRVREKQNNGKVCIFFRFGRAPFSERLVGADDILVRTAQHDRDYTGGANGQATIEKVGWKLEALTN